MTINRAVVCHYLSRVVVSSIQTVINNFLVLIFYIFKITFRNTFQNIDYKDINQSKINVSLNLHFIYIFLFLINNSALGYETDPFSHRLHEIKDATELLNDQVNQAIKAVVNEWKGEKNEKKIVYQVYRKLGGKHWVDKLEKFVNKSQSIDKLPTRRFHSIYSTMPLRATRVTGIMGVGPIFKLNNQLIGTDKLGHFFSQGKKFYYRYLKYKSIKKAAERSAFTERAIFGQKTTGSYSNADLVANYEGFLFYLSFFNDDTIAGKKSILKWQNGHWVIQRSFDWRDHVNPFWDEGININHFDKWLQPHVKKALLQHCQNYKNNPESYTIDPDYEKLLIEKYKFLKLKLNFQLRLDQLCIAS